MLKRRPDDRPRKTHDGPVYNGPEFWQDPTENVKALSEALSQRQDDLRDLNNKYLDARLDAMEATAVLRAAHSQEIRHLEADRLEKIRMVDVSNTAIAAAQQLAGINTLATTVASKDEAVRSNLGTTASAIQAQTDRIVGGITERLAALEKSSYTGAGRAGMADPQMEKLVDLVAGLARDRSAGEGTRRGIELSWGVVVAVFGLLFGLVASGVAVYGLLR